MVQAWAHVQGMLSSDSTWDLDNPDAPDPLGEDDLPGLGPDDEGLDIDENGCTAAELAELEEQARAQGALPAPKRRSRGGRGRQARRAAAAPSRARRAGAGSLAHLDSPDPVGSQSAWHSRLQHALDARLTPPLPDEPSWSDSLLTSKGALMVTALHQYFCWRRFHWGYDSDGAVSPFLQLRRLESAWMHVRG